MWENNKRFCYTALFFKHLSGKLAPQLARKRERERKKYDFFSSSKVSIFFWHSEFSTLLSLSLSLSIFDRRATSARLTYCKKKLLESTAFPILHGVKQRKRKWNSTSQFSLPECWRGKEDFQNVIFEKKNNNNANYG